MIRKTKLVVAFVVVLAFGCTMGSSTKEPGFRPEMTVYEVTLIDYCDVNGKRDPILTGCSEWTKMRDVTLSQLARGRTGEDAWHIVEESTTHMIVKQNFRDEKERKPGDYGYEQWKVNMENSSCRKNSGWTIAVFNAKEECEQFKARHLLKGFDKKL
jgi:hypothetical protein